MTSREIKRQFGVGISSQCSREWKHGMETEHFIGFEPFASRHRPPSGKYVAIIGTGILFVINYSCFPNPVRIYP